MKTERSIMKIKIIGLDLDGTLLNEKKELTPYSKGVLLEATKRGIIVLAATGRPLSGVPSEILELPGMRYVLTANGARIIDTKENLILWEALLDDGMSKEILKIFSEYDTLREICYDGVSYAEETQLKETKRYVATKAMSDYIMKTRKPVSNLWTKVQEMQGQGMDKIQAVFARSEDKEEAWGRIRQLGDLSISGALGNNIEVNAPGVNKGTALLKLGELLGILQEESMACGDGNNDVEMLKAVGIGVAMANAVPEAKAAADYITDSNEADGAAKAIQQFALGGIYGKSIHKMK